MEKETAEGNVIETYRIMVLGEGEQRLATSPNARAWGYGMKLVRAFFKAMK